MKNLSATQKLFIKIAGYDVETAKSCTSSEVNKMSKHAGLILVPAIVGLFSMSYAMFLITQSVFFAILGGFIWSVLIFIIDRSLVSSGRPGSFSFGLLGRLFLAIVIGFVVAEPVVLLAFKDSIKESIYDKFLIKKKKINSKYAPSIALYKKELNNAKKRLNSKQESYVGEMDGTSGSGKANKGPIFKQKYQDYQDELISFKKLELDIKEKIAKKNTLFNNEVNDAKKKQAKGLLGQFRALHSIEDPEVKYATWALRLFFFFIELIPFLIKITPSKKSILYYDLIDNYDQIQLEIVTSNNTYRKELMESQERSLNKERILKLNELDTEKVAFSNDRNTEYLMKQMHNAIDKKLKQEFRIYKTIKDEKARKELLEKLNFVFNGYLNNMEALIIKSNQFYSNNI